MKESWGRVSLPGPGPLVATRPVPPVPQSRKRLRAVFEVTFAAIALAGAWNDLRTHRIPNVLTLSGLLLALALRAWLGFDAVLDGFWGACIAFLIALPLFAIGGFGGGDAKFLIALGAFLGASRLFGGLLAIALAGGVFAVLHAVRRGVIVPVLLNCGAMLRYWLSFGRSGRRIALDSPGVTAIPYGVPLAFGSLAWWFFGGRFP